MALTPEKRDLGLLSRQFSIDSHGDSISGQDLTLELTVQKFKTGLESLKLNGEELTKSFENLDAHLSSLEKTMGPIRTKTGKLQETNAKISKGIELLQNVHAFFQFNEEVEKVIKCGIKNNTSNYMQAVKRIDEAMEFMKKNSQYRSSEGALNTLTRQRQEIQKQCAEEYRRLLAKCGQSVVWVDGAYTHRELIGENASVPFNQLSACLAQLQPFRPATIYTEVRLSTITEAVQSYRNRWHQGQVANTLLEEATHQAYAEAWCKQLQFTIALLRGEKQLWSRTIANEAQGRPEAFSHAVKPAIEALRELTEFIQLHLQGHKIALKRKKKKKTKSPSKAESVMSNDESSDGEDDEEAEDLETPEPEEAPAPSPVMYQRKSLKARVRAKMHLGKSKASQSNEKPDRPKTKTDKLRGLVGLKKKSSKKTQLLNKERTTAVLTMLAGFIQEEKRIKDIFPASASTENVSTIDILRKVELSLFSDATKVLLEAETTICVDASSSELPSSGSVHPITDSVVRFCRDLIPFHLTLENLCQRMGNQMSWMQNTTGLSGQSGKAFCTKLLVNHYMRLLIQNLQAMALNHQDLTAKQSNQDASLVEAFTHVFLLNNFTYLLRSQSHQVGVGESDLPSTKDSRQKEQIVFSTLQDALEEDLMQRLSGLERAEREQYFDCCWGSLIRGIDVKDVQVTSKNGRQTIKDCWVAFNRSINKIAEQQTPLSIPDATLKIGLKDRAKQLLIPKYTDFYNKYHNLNFRHPGKYVVYTPLSVSETINNLFSG